MRIASWNTRSFGNIEKGRMVGSMVNKYQIQFLAIQETMVKKVKQPILNSIWKHFVFQEVQVSSNGRSGGLLSIWHDDCFTLLNHWSNRYWIATLLRYTLNQRIVLIINIYAPQSEHDKLFVWQQLSAIANQWSGPISFLGDFNSVCHPEERFREVIDPIAISKFNNFILSDNVIDQALCNEEFTWDGPDEKMSRIDRVMVNVSWLSLFPDSILQAGLQKLSNHKPIILGKKLQDWGPKPFRFNNSWLLQKKFITLCNEKWDSLDYEGWAAFTLSMKFRVLKCYLRE
ncbi:uncharacterized protein [Rutidosis leptorrhynchoides]|uniref:uncharacterized protein n=1 Tax=Rutidosis leptorrhynchoides TaxID=125765 RepID=UPI003A98FA0A